MAPALTSYRALSPGVCRKSCDCPPPRSCAQDPAVDGARTSADSADPDAERPDLRTSAADRLELLDQRPGLSNAELARWAFVTRQSMNVVLRGLQDSGLVTRPPQAPHGRALPLCLLTAGEKQGAAPAVTEKQ